MECIVRACIYIAEGVCFDYCVYYVNKCCVLSLMLFTFFLKVAHVNTEIALPFSLVNCIRHRQL